MSKGTDRQTLYYLGAGGVLLVGGVWYLHWQAGRLRSAAVDGAKGVGQAVNPVSQDNIFNRSANAITDAVTVEEGRTLGIMFADWINPPPEK